MQYNKIDLQDYLQNYHTKQPTQETLQSFINHLNKLQTIKTNENEEHQKNAFRDFLRESFNYNCNTKGRIDLAIYNDYDNEAIEVIFEFKSLSNKQEFPKDSHTLQSKSFYETILKSMRPISW